MCVRMFGWMDGLMEDGWIDRDRQICRQVHGWMDGWMDGLRRRQTHIDSNINSFSGILTKI